MNAGRLYDELRLRGYRLTASDGRLEVRGPVPLPADLRAAVAEAKPTLIRFAQEFAEQSADYDYPVAGTCANCGRFAWRPKGAPATGWTCHDCPIGQEE